MPLSERLFQKTLYGSTDNNKVKVDVDSTSHVPSLVVNINIKCHHTKLYVICFFLLVNNKTHIFLSSSANNT